MDEHLQRRLEEVSQQFFAQDLETKLEIACRAEAKPGADTSPSVAELTSGKPDLKEGIYFGAELRMITPL